MRWECEHECLFVFICCFCGELATARGPWTKANRTPRSSGQTSGMIINSFDLTVHRNALQERGDGDKLSRDCNPLERSHQTPHSKSFRVNRRLSAIYVSALGVSNVLSAARSRLTGRLKRPYCNLTNHGARPSKTNIVSVETRGLVY